nr:hypothetical protein [Mycoplasma haemofelis]
MNKALMFSLAGVTGAGASGLLAVNHMKNKNSIRNKFPKSLIGEKDDGIWVARVKSLVAQGSSPFNEKLKKVKAIPLASNEPTEESKTLLKKACQEIYDSYFSGEDSNEFKDLKSFCSKNNKDVAPQDKWFTEDTTSSAGTKWSARLTSLKGHSGSLVQKLKDLKSGLTSASYTKENATALKNWCDSIASDMYVDDLGYSNMVLFCRES